MKLVDSFINVILGPRQVGKTTAILHYLENQKGSYHYATSDEVLNPTTQWIEEQWQKAKEKSKSCILAIDEIQKVPQWSSVIKKLWDAQKKNKGSLKVILLGSSSLQLQQGLSESLAGRFFLHRAYHWNFIETQKIKKMNLDQFLKYGGYPGSYQLTSDPKQWAHYIRESIIEAVISKDILTQARVAKPALFRQSFEVLMSYSAQEISYNKLLGQLQEGGNVDLVKYYLQLFEGAYLLKSLQKFSNKSHLKKASSPKIVALCPALVEWSRDDKEEQGRVFESLVGADLIRAGLDVHYWREGNFEVDYVVKSGKSILAIEVKSGRKKNSKSLEKFEKHFKSSKKIFINYENYETFCQDPEGFMKLNSF